MAIEHHLAQVNVALARKPLYSRALAEFVAALAPIDARAHRAPGFVWRMQFADGGAAAIREFGRGRRLVINLSSGSRLRQCATSSTATPNTSR